MLAPQEECFSNIVQDFLICTTVHKARQIGTFQSGVYVRVTLDKMVRHTRTYENSENPFFNQYFVFEVRCTLMELMRLTILYEMKKRTTCKKNPTLGELVIDMQSVWNQPNRCYFKKWGRFETPIGQIATAEGGGNDGRGFLQIDLAIVSQASNPHTLLRPSEEDFMVLNKWQMHTDYDDIEKNLLENVDTGVRCNIRYSVMFYRGVMAKKSDYMLQFRFHPFKGKANVIKNTTEPSWNQEMSFVWTYPSLAQSFGIQLMMHEHLQWKCVSEYEVHFNEIAFNDKPALGPTYIHFYDNLDSSHYIGRLLFQIKSECLETELNHVMTIKKVTPLDEKHYWHEENFLIEFMAVQGDFIHCNVSNCKIGIKIAEHNSNFLEINLKNYTTSTKKGQHTVKNVKCFLQQTPFKTISLRIRLPDNRTKFESDVYLQEIWDFIRTELEFFKLFQIYYAGHKQTQLKVLRNILLKVVTKMEQAIENNRLDHNSSKEATKWDINRLAYLKEYFSKILKDLREMRLKLKCFKDPYFDLVFDEVLVDLIQCSNQLQHLMSRTLAQDEWPDLILVLQSGSKEVGFCRLNAKNFLYPGRERETHYSSHCWQLKNFIFKDVKCQHTCLNCGCTVALMRGCLSIVAESENNDFTRFINPYWQHPEPFYWYPHNVLTTFKSRLFIHQAKIRPGTDRSGLCDPYVRVMLYQYCAETSVVLSSLSPIWNTVISFDNLQMPGEFEWYRKHPPLVAIEIYDTDKRTADDFLGCGVLALTVVKGDNTDMNNKTMGDWDHVERPKHALEKYEFLKSVTPPPLKWIPIALSGAIRAEVLMSGELVQVADAVTTEIAVNVESQTSVTVGIPTAIKPNMKNFVLEAVFAGFRNYQKQNFLMGKHRVKLMLADLVLASGLSTSPINNSMNFLVLYAAGVVSLPEQLEYWPAIIATDMAVASKGQESTLGATIIANSKRYLQKEKHIPCVPMDAEDEFEDEDVPSTTVQIDDEDDAMASESQPLIPPKASNSYFQLIIKKFKLPKRKRKKADEMYDLKDIIDENDYNWWTKFYNSGYIEPCGTFSEFKHKLCIYSNELEKQPEFSYLNDWAEPVHMVHGVKYKKNSVPHEEIYATLKIHLKITRCMCKHFEDRRLSGGGGDAENHNTLKPLATALNPRYQAQLQSLADLVKIVARVYVIQGIQLRPSGKNIQADSYVTVQLGQKQMTNRAEYVSNDSNPIFGKCFQVDGLLPREHLLEVAIFNRRDVKDDVIGSTIIDLEDRWRSKHRATVGIANEFSSYGYNKWHDYLLPLEILEDLCKSNDIRPPKFIENTIEVDGVRFEDETQIGIDEDLKQRLSITVLKNFELLPSFGYKLVPEHVETRSLYRTECPGIEQGKIQLWIELYDANLNIPPPIDIMPLPPQLYELRVIIYNVSDVVLNEKNIFGTAMSDIYLKGWCSSYDDAQSTDIHYRSLNGEGNFNWRMLFPLKYSLHEDMVVVKHRPGFMEEYEQKQPPILHIQIWDIDFLSADDFLGLLEINLSGFPEPFPTSKKCQLLDVTYSQTSVGSTTKKKKPQSSRKLINLFKEKHVRGWFPVRGNLNNPANKQSQIGLAGKVDLEMDMLTIEEAKADPVGLGREGPKPLPEPKRPKSSFNPLKNPWKGFKRIILPKFLKLCLIIFVVVIVGMVLYHFITTLPGTMMGWGY